ncbi:MAG: DUF1501 domain-containing protein [Shimia sp.]|uniref:DUF1501 domain-containing protein n=1 Tax=Shimia sp. TaxID=1954381 RepID=UPI004057EFF9
MSKRLTRRNFLTHGAAIGCSVAASPLLTPVSFAAAPTDNRLVVIVLRGGLDGLDLLRPRQEALLPVLRPTLSASNKGEIPLEGGFGLHPECAPLYPLWQAGQLAFVNAVSTPYRDKRSHFDGQDLLEAGIASIEGDGVRDGWLNRAIGTMKGVDVQTAYAIGTEPMLLSRGDAEITSWSPDVDFILSQQGVALMQNTLRGDPEMSAAMATAMGLASQSGGGTMDATELEEAMDMMMNPAGKGARGAHVRVAEFAADRLREEARIACFSLGGWDTHFRQSNTLRAPLRQLVDTLLTLHTRMGAAAWQRTTVVAMTEFGRTAAENGTKGTDHGTGGAMVLAGGALRKSGVYGQWPGMDEAALYKRRDLMPTDDVRRWAAWALRSSFGLERSLLETEVFPGIDLGADPRLLA